ncbi:hypothetical protein UA08_07849 [Talaromyces atroroseus]|uniref:Uncharacterized protein n=1 Tax=Talaromyces atroroseus TaxID=1441469 RepID=A0A225AID9_TALAT|nr:hypothetical protein UA08_07849 [Talaromyces atroroseus]OKL56898.1 hypothetical protein UA08_07849 [Talaromyces atroroseus]
MIWVRYLARNPRPILRQYRAFTTGGSRIVNVQPVKIKRPWFRRFATSVLVYGAAFNLWSSLLYSHLDGNTLADSEGNSGGLGEGIVDGGKEAVDEDEEEDVTFIPLSWPRLRPGELYTGNDPEWNCFRDYAHDRKRLESLKRELEGVVLTRVSCHPKFKDLLGDNMRIMRSWLFVQFPYRAPPHYETVGFEISDNEIVLKSKPIPDEQGRLILAALFPFTVTSAMGHAASAFFHRKLQRVKKSFGIDEDPTNDVIMSIKDMDVPSDLQPSNNISLSSYSEWEKSIANIIQETSPSTANTNTNTTHTQPSRLPKILSVMQMLPSQYQDSDLYVAYLTFKLHMMKHEMQQRNPISPRGVFYFNGPIGLVGSKGLCRLEVRGEYNPDKAEWSSITMKLKDFNFIRQEPLGYQRPS